MSARLRRAAAAAAWLVAVLALQEAALRLLFPLPEIRSFNRAHYMRRAPGDPLPPLRSLRILWESEPDGARFAHGLNAYGFRDREWTLAKPTGALRVMIVGDSFVEGTMATDDATIPRAFEAAAARAGRRVEAMNLGVMGADLSHAFQLIDDAVPLFRPDAVLLVLFANDLPPPAFDVVRAPPERFERWLPRLLVVARMLARGEMPPLRFRLHTVPYHVPASDPHHPWHGREAEVRARMREDLARSVLEGRFNPYRVGGARSLEETLRAPIDLAGPLRFLARTVARHGARLFVAYLPDRNQVTRHYAPFEAALGAGQIDLTGPAYQRHRREIARDCRSARVPFLDLAPLLHREEQAGHRVYWDYDDHMRAAGYRLVGEALFEWWSRAAPAPAADAGGAAALERVRGFRGPSVRRGRRTAVVWDRGPFRRAGRRRRCAADAGPARPSRSSAALASCGRSPRSPARAWRPPPGSPSRAGRTEPASASDSGPSGSCVVA